MGGLAHVELFRPDVMLLDVAMPTPSGYEVLSEMRRSRLTAALGAVLTPGIAPELQLVHRWLDSWIGVGLLAAGLQRQGWDLQLTAYGEGHWRATFWVTGRTHSLIGGWGYEATAWAAVQRAGWLAVGKDTVAWGA